MPLKGIFCIIPPQRLLTYAVIIFIGIVLALRLSIPTFFSPYDPYYHVSHAHTYNTGVPIHFPLLSTMNTGDEGGDLYVLYHRFIALILPWFENDTTADLPLGFIVFHAVVFALFWSTFAYVLATLLRTYSSHVRPTLITYGILIGVAFLWNNYLFLWRLFLERPHTISTMILLLGTLSIIQRRWWLLGILSVLFPLLYSVSFLLCIPAGLYLVWYIAYSPHAAATSKPFIPLAVVVGGLALGIVLHPTSLHYLYNGYYIHLTALANALIGIHSIPFELRHLYLRFYDYLWLLPFLGILMFYGKRFFATRSVHNTISFEKGYLLTVVFSLFVITLAIERTIELFLPFVVIFLVWITLDEVTPHLKTIYRDLQHKSQFSRATQLVYELLGEFGQRRRLFLGLLGGVICAFSIATTYGVFKTGPLNAHLHDDYTNALAVLNLHAAPGDVVFHTYFGAYPRGVFHTPSLHYLLGMGASFTYQFDPALYWLHAHTTQGGAICAQATCREGDIMYDIYTAMTHVFGARYVLVTTNPRFPGVSEASDTTSALSEPAIPLDELDAAIQHDQRFELIYHDQAQQTKLYTVLPPPYEVQPLVMP